MRCVCTLWIWLFILIIYLKFARTENAAKINSTLNLQSISSAGNNSLLTTENVTDAVMETVTEHIAVQKWKKADNALKNLLTSMYKQMLPFVLRGNEGLDLSPGCSRGLMKMLTGLKQSKLWAFKSKISDFLGFKYF